MHVTAGQIDGFKRYDVGETGSGSNGDVYFGTGKNVKNGTEYEMKTSGTCSYYIDSKQQCENAAIYFGLFDTTAVDDQSVNDRPKGCYIIQNTDLKFNVLMDNTGSCTGRFTCLCYRYQYSPSARSIFSNTTNKTITIGGSVSSKVISPSGLAINGWDVNSSIIKSSALTV